MTPAEFFAQALPYAQAASQQTGVLVSVVLAQWADETGYGGQDWEPNHNPGNVGSYDGQPVATFPTLQAGVDAYVQTMNASDRPEFAATIRTLPTYQQQCQQLGAADPVWAAGRYDAGTGPGSALVAIIEANNLTQYDSDPVPSILEELFMPTDNGLFVRWAYHVALLREPDIQGYTDNVDALNAGTISREQVFTNLLDSPEGQQVIAGQRRAFGLP